MNNQFSRTELLVGKDSLEYLKTKKVAVFGIGGVGGYVVEALARFGIFHFVIVDNDIVSISNINRQIIATHSNVGRSKVEVMKERIMDINPDADVEIIQKFYLPENREEFDFSKYDFVIDAVDTVSAKIDIIVRCKEEKIPVISAMGAGNKMEPTLLQVSDISKTEYDPLAKVMRRELRKRGINHLKVVYSKEKPLVPQGKIDEETNKRSVPGSTSFVPSAMGLIIASEVIRDLLINRE